MGLILRTWKKDAHGLAHVKILFNHRGGLRKQMIVTRLCWCLVIITINYSRTMSKIYLLSTKFSLDSKPIMESIFRKQKLCLPKCVVELWSQKQSTVMRHDQGRIDHHVCPCLLECVFMRWKLVEATKIGLYVVSFLFLGKQRRFIEFMLVFIIDFRIGMLRYFLFKKSYYKRILS